MFRLADSFPTGKRFQKVGFAFAALLLTMALAPLAQAVGPCCGIIRIDARSGVVTAQETATGRVFEFTVPNAGVLASLKVGQRIYANFGAGQISLDGRSACCRITALGAAPAAPVAPSVKAPAPTQPAAAAPPNARTSPAQAAPASSSAAPAQPAALGTRQRPSTQRPGGASAAPASTPPPGNAPLPPANSSGPRPGSGTAGGAKQAPVAMDLPQISFGAPVLQDGNVESVERRAAGRLAAGKQNLVRLHGVDEIKNATSLPQGARDFILLHARQVPAGEVNDYVVNVPMAVEWFNKHPEPDVVRQAAAKAEPKPDGHTGCNTISTHCLEESGKHAEDEASRQYQKLIQEAQDEWKHVTGEAAKDLNASVECFADHPLPSQDVPVNFSLPIQYPLSFEKDGKSDNKYGGVSGKVKGTVTVGLPVNAHFMAHVTMFYIPCLPFAYRPRSLGADGNLTVAATLGATVNATGQFQELFMIPPPPTDPHIPIEVIPIVIAGAPVAEMDVSIHFDGSLAVDGEGVFDTQFKLNAPHTTAFDFDCDGHGCSGRAHNVPVPVTTTESAQVAGRIHMKPAIYTALQLDFDGNVLTARAGPQPYLWGELYGCGAASLTQSTAAPTTTQTQYALTADVDWGIELRAEALAAGNKLGGFTREVMQRRHIWFKDLVGSTGLAPDLEGVAQVGVGRPAAYTVKMRQCYPYSDAVEYALSWSGGAGDAFKAAPVTAIPGLARAGGIPGSQCTLQTGHGDCWGDPSKQTSFDLAWPAAGNFTLQAAPVRDKHGREFGALPQQQTQVQVTVQP